MAKPLHPGAALFKGERPFPVIACCDHYAGSEKLIRKALELQQRLGPLFDITCDCEDGAQAGQEIAHAAMVVRMLNDPANAHRMAGARIHDPSHEAWKQDAEALIAGAGKILSHITIPKVTCAAQAAEMIAHIGQVSVYHGTGRTIPIHVLIETHGALRDAHAIAALAGVRALDFGLMDFIAGHYGAIPATAMRSPGQFDHRLLARAKAEVVAAALANGIVPAHNVTLDLKNTETVYQDARRAREEFGFLRMWSIHPAQIEPILKAMRPDYSEVQDAARILLAARAANWGPIQHAGQLHDRATYRYYWELLQRAHATGADIPEDAAGAFFDRA